MSIFRSVALFTVASACLVAATPALAADTVVRRVAYGDLDLSQQKGVATLNRRIAIAVEAVCGSYANADSIAADRVTACRETTKAMIAPQLASALGRSPIRTTSLEVAGPRR